MQMDGLAAQLVVGISVFALLLVVTVTEIPPHFICLAEAVFLYYTGIISETTVTESFGSSSVLTIASLTVSVSALQRTPLFRAAIARILQVQRGAAKLSRKRLRLIMICAGLISAFTNNIPLYMLITEAVNSWSSLGPDGGTVPRWTFVGLSYACIAGGTLSTLGTSTHFVVQDLLADGGHSQIKLWELAFVGFPVFVCVILYSFLLDFALKGDKSIVEAADPTQDSHLENEKDMTEINSKQNTGKSTPKSRYPRQGAEQEYVNSHVYSQHGGESQPISACIAAREDDGKLTVSGDPETASSENEGAQYRRYTMDHLPGDVDFSESVARPPNDSNPSNSQSYTWLNKKLLWDCFPLYVFTGWIVVSALAVVNQGILSMTMVLILVSLGFVDKDVVFSRQKPSILLVIASMIAVGQAVENSGVGRSLGSVIITIGGGHPVLAFGAFTFSVIVLTELVTNVASAAVMFPVAVAISSKSGIPIKPFAIGLMITASSSFGSPLGYPTNMMALRLGGVNKKEMLQVGLGLALLVWLIQWGVISAIYLI